jgi:hypothetical protein
MNMLSLALAGLLATLAAASAQAASAAPLTTVSERSGFVQTGRYTEVVALCHDFQKVYPQAVRCVEFGRTPEGRPMLALVASRSGALTAQAARRRQLPVLLVQGGIHAGEIDGKDAGFKALREVLEGRAAPGALDKQVLIFVPVFNIDGHERFGAWNRPNQRGPQEMGWRTTAQNYNLNRDYVKADTPEMQAMLRLVNAWDPLAYIDLHVTDGAKFEHDISIQVEPLHGGNTTLQQAGAVFRDNVIASLARQGSSPLPYYPEFVVEDDPSSGFVDGVPTPRFSHGYFPLRNRFGMLVETHSWKDYPTRVRLTYNTVVAVLEQIASHGGQWLQAAHAADAAPLGGQSVPLSYSATGEVRTVEFRGYEYTRTPSEVSGTLMTRYDETKPQIWRLPLRDHVAPELSVTAPQAGYLVPPAHAGWVAEKLKQHGVAFKLLDKAYPRLAVETFRAEQTQLSAKSNESHQTLSLKGQWRAEPRDLGAGALFVPIAQAKARLVMTLLEPQSPDSLAAWGRFNNAFEKKEYMEAYVAEDVARAQLAADPQLAAAFHKKLADEPEFAKDPAARLEFFARRHASWDERYNLYPVLRIAIEPR